MTVAPCSSAMATEGGWGTQRSSQISTPTATGSIPGSVQRNTRPAPKGTGPCPAKGTAPAGRKGAGANQRRS